MDKREARHTAGPWFKASRGFEQKPSIVARPNGKAVSVAVFEREADRDFALAAPDLYAALVNIMNGIETGAVRIETDQDETWENAMLKARDAIAKARTGGQG